MIFHHDVWPVSIFSYIKNKKLKKCSDELFRAACFLYLLFFTAPAFITRILQFRINLLNLRRMRSSVYVHG